MAEDMCCGKLRKNLGLRHWRGRLLGKLATSCQDECGRERDELVVPQQRHHGKSDDEVVLPRQEQHDEETTIPAEGAKGNSSATAFQVLPEVTTDEPVHIVLLGDSTLDNYRYLDLTAGERTVEMLLSKRCKEMNWELTVLAMDGSTLEDVAVRQVPVALAVLKGVARGDLDTG
eukprot:s208_g1.t2